MLIITYAPFWSVELLGSHETKAHMPSLILWLESVRTIDSHSRTRNEQGRFGLNHYKVLETWDCLKYTEQLRRAGKNEWFWAAPTEREGGKKTTPIQAPQSWFNIKSWLFLSFFFSTNTHTRSHTRKSSIVSDLASSAQVLGAAFLSNLKLIAMGPLCVTSEIWVWRREYEGLDWV